MMGNRSQKDDRIRRRDAVSGRDSKQVVDVFLQKPSSAYICPSQSKVGIKIGERMDLTADRLQKLRRRLSSHCYSDRRRRC
jgi:hypothetical protein